MARKSKACHICHRLGCAQTQSIYSYAARHAGIRCRHIRTVCFHLHFSSKQNACSNRFRKHKDIADLSAAERNGGVARKARDAKANRKLGPHTRVATNNLRACVPHNVTRSAHDFIKCAFL